MTALKYIGDCGLFRVFETEPSLQSALLAKLLVQRSAGPVPTPCVYAKKITFRRSDTQNLVANGGHCAAFTLITTSAYVISDSVPSHRTRETVKLLKAETTDFIPPAQWPLNNLRQ